MMSNKTFGMKQQFFQKKMNKKFKNYKKNNKKHQAIPKSINQKIY